MAGVLSDAVRTVRLTLPLDDLQLRIPAAKKCELCARLAEPARYREPHDVLIEPQRSFDILYIDSTP
jgi:hypothetical protein